MDKTLFVHVGAPKTGTKAIQMQFAIYSPLLRLLGLNFPRLSAEHRFRNQDIADDIRHTKGAVTQKNYFDLIERSRQPRHFLSAESLLSLKEAPHYFAPFTKIARVAIVIFVRRQDRFIESIYRQMVRNRAAFAPFETFLTRRVNDGSFGNRMDWLEKTLPWERIFGRENMIVIPYEEYNRVDSVITMATLLEVPLLARMPKISQGNHPSLSCETTEYLRSLHARKIAYRKRRVDVFDRRQPIRTDAYLSMEPRQALILHYAGLNAQLAERHAVDLGALTTCNVERESRRMLFKAEDFQIEEMDARARACRFLKRK